MRTNSKSKAACFTCRYSIKGWRDNCAICKSPMHNVGPKFRTPPKRDVKAWTIMKLFWVDPGTTNIPDGGWIAHGPLHSTVRAQEKQLSENRKAVTDHDLFAWRYCSERSRFPYMTFKRIGERLKC